MPLMIQERLKKVRNLWSGKDQAAGIIIDIKS